jgi:SAM-dependent methyltransferase
MFALSDADLRGRVLGCGDGPAAFNAEATRRGSRVMSCDPIYKFTAAEIRGRIDETATVVLEQTRRERHEFVWESIGSVDELGRVRMAAMQSFLADFGVGAATGRYVAAALPALPFADRAFDLAVCSHLLFLYSAQLDRAFHLAAVKELCRVAREVRVFPLVALGNIPSPHVDSVKQLGESGYSVAIERVPYEFQRGANQMMRIAPW